MIEAFVKRGDLLSVLSRAFSRDLAPLLWPSRKAADAMFSTTIAILLPELDCMLFRQIRIKAANTESGSGISTPLLGKSTHKKIHLFLCLFVCVLLKAAFFMKLPMGSSDAVVKKWGERANLMWWGKLIKFEDRYTNSRMAWHTNYSRRLPTSWSKQTVFRKHWASNGTKGNDSSESRK